MKKICIVGLLAGFCGFAQATTVSLSNVSTLEGNDAYEWGIGITVPTGSQVTSATLTFSDITLTAANSSGTGVLYSDLLNGSNSKFTTFVDNDAPGDYFKSSSSPFTSGNVASLNTENFAKVGTTQSWSVTFNASEIALLNTFLSDGYFAIGLDPDCHYTVGSVCFTYNVGSSKGSPTPDVTATVLLFGLSLLGLEAVRRRFVLAKTK